MKKIKYILIVAVVMWMVAVFCYSHQTAGKSNYKSRKIAEVIVELKTETNQLSAKEKEDLIKTFNRVIRKIAHYLIYTLGGIVLIFLVNTCKITYTKKIICSQVIGTFYAIADEVHQYFVER